MTLGADTDTHTHAHTSAQKCGRRAPGLKIPIADIKNFTILALPIRYIGTPLALGGKQASYITVMVGYLCYLAHHDIHSYCDITITYL